MLYTSRKGRNGKDEQVTLQEDSLQAYFFCRLRDRLKGRISDIATPFLNREPLAECDERIDIKAEAITLSLDNISVTIELKWSHNSGLAEGLEHQLGDKYLTNKCAYGIYLVGWSGKFKWKEKYNPRPKPNYRSSCCNMAPDKATNPYLR
jgi:hypothetical protein